MVNCVTFGCGSRSGCHKSKTQISQEVDQCSKIRFYKFPSDANLCERWVKAVNRKNFTPSKNSFICSLHFKNDCFELRGSKFHLKPNSCPTLFPTHPVSSQVPCKIPRMSRTDKNICKATSILGSKVAVENALTQIARSKITFSTPSNSSNSFTSATSNTFESVKSPFVSSFQDFTKTIFRSNSQNLTSSITSEQVDILNHPAPIDPSSCIDSASIHYPHVSDPVSQELSSSPFTNDVVSSYSMIAHNSVASQTNPVLSLVPENIPHLVEEKSSSDIHPVPSISHSKFQLRSIATQTDPEIETPRKKKLRATILKNSLEHKRKLFSLKKLNRRKILNLQAKLRRKEKKEAQYKDVIAVLKEKNLLSSEQIEALNTLPRVHNELLMRSVNKKINKKVPKKYGEDLKAFALTLHFFSGRGYSFVRDAFDSCLPHPSTLSAWYKQVDGRPGFTAEAFDTLKQLSANSKVPIYCCLILDEMAIRRQIELVGNNFVGYVDMGTGLEGDDRPLAHDALVFMLVGLNTSWKIPVGYFLISGLTGEQKAGLVLQCLYLATESGVHVKTLTSDGPAQNIAMAKELGCNINDLSENAIFFKHPATKQKVFFFLDACHMVKLVRNLFENLKVIYDQDGNAIKWEFIEKLQKLQEKEGVHLANKLRKKHVKFYNQKMKVRLAVQVLSSSVADALECCLELNLPEFEGSEATVKFLRTFNNVFDICNTKNLAQRHFKKPLCQSNYEFTKNYLKDVIVYIQNLKCQDGGQLLKSSRKIGPLGFVILAKNIINLYEDLCINTEPPLLFIPTYRFSQDHLEMFFGIIRMKGGFNNNPSARQFQAAYKRVLIQAEIKASANGNCISLENIPILACSSSPEKMLNLSTSNNRCSREEIDVETLREDFSFIAMSDFCKNVNVYIAGFVIRALCRTLKCEECIEALTSCPIQSHCTLIHIKNRGGLITPSSDVVKIINFSEQTLQNFLRTKSGQLYVIKSLQYLVAVVMNNFFPDSNIFPSLDDHLYDSEALCNHKYLLTKSICQKYLKTKLHYITKNISDQTATQRQMFNKLILFRGQ